MLQTKQKLECAIEAITTMMSYQCRPPLRMMFVKISMLHIQAKSKHEPAFLATVFCSLALLPAAAPEMLTLPWTSSV